MASLTDDLRYLSRTGYRDPWAEATNNITDSLFQLANTKYQRDTLLAQIQNREEEREYQRSRDTKLDAIQEEERAYRRAQDKLEREDDDKDEFFKTYKLFDNDPESRRDLINTPEALKYFKSNPETLETLKLNLNNEVEAKKEISKVLGMTDETIETYESLIGISSNPYINTQERAFVNTRLKNLKTILDDKAEAQQNMQYFDSIVSQGYIKQNSPMYQVISDAIKFKKYQQANQLITKSISKSGDAAKLFRNRFEELTDNHNRALESDTEEVINTSMAQLNSFIETTLPTLPPKYENYYRKKVQTGVTSPSQMFSTFEGILNLWNNGLEPTDENFGKSIIPVNGNESGNQESYVNINNINEEEFVLPDTSMVEVNVGDTTQTVTGVAANNLIRSNRGNIVENTAYSEIEMGSPSGNFGRVGAAISGIEQPGSITLSFKTGKRIPTLTSDFTGNLGFESMSLENGDEVMDKKTKERFPLIIKDQATTGVFPTVNMETSQIRKNITTEGKYIVNGTTYTFDGLKEKFGVPLYQKQVRMRYTSEPMPVNANMVRRDTTLNIEDLQVRVINTETGDTTELQY